jgi:hypothetical protein
MTFGNAPLDERLFIFRRAVRGTRAANRKTNRMSVFNFVSPGGFVARNLRALFSSAGRANVPRPHRIRSGGAVSCSRSRRFAIARKRAPWPRRKAAIHTRVRRGSSSPVGDVWRRWVIGPNGISNIGVWKRGARRVAQRINRRGETGWRRPHRRNCGCFAPRPA